MIDTRRHLPHWIPDNVPVFVTWCLAGAYANRISDRSLHADPARPKHLANPEVATIIVNTLHYGHEVRSFYDLHAYVIMPNHVHVVWTPHISMSKITQWLKGTTSRRSRLLLQFPPGPFWQDESYDHWVRNRDELTKIIHYVEHNPVKAGLAATPDAWPWSSTRWDRRSPKVPPV